MIKNIGSVINKAVSTVTDNVGLAAIQKALQNQLNDTIESVFLDRQNDPINSHFNPVDENKILEEYLTKNIAIATASSFIPGPAGVLAAVPSMVTTISNQMKASYDIACAYGKESLVIKDLLIDIPLQSMGVPTGLAYIQEAKTLMESSEDESQTKIIGFMKVYVQKKLKRAITRSIPGMSTTFAIAEAKLDTEKTIATASSFFDDNKTIIDPMPPQQEKLSQAEYERLKSLINLMTIDSTSSENEQAYIMPLIDNSELSDELKSSLKESIDPSLPRDEVDYEVISDAGIQEQLILDMVVLTKRDDKIVSSEIDYVKKTAEELHIDHQLYQSLLG